MVDFEGIMSSPRTDSSSAAQAMDLSAWRWPLTGAAVLLALFTYLFWGFLRSQVLRAYAEQADWGHTLVVPFIAGYFVYLNREHLLAQPFRTTWLGLAPIVLGVGIYVTSTMVPTLNHFNIQGAGVWLTLVGIVLLFTGWRAMTWLWFPLIYLFCFGQNISERLLNKVTFGMQDITARGAHFLMGLWLDVDLNGNTISIHYNGQDKALNIAQACSGMRMLMAFLALGVAMAYTGLRPTSALAGLHARSQEMQFGRRPGRISMVELLARPFRLIAGAALGLFVLTIRNWQRVLLVILAVPTAIFVNILRVITLGLLSLVDAALAADDFHKLVGLVWLIPAFLIYLGLMWIIKHLMVEEQRRAPLAG